MNLAHTQGIQASKPQTKTDSRPHAVALIVQPIRVRDKVVCLVRAQVPGTKAQTSRG